jgi:hypothetical protein
LSFRAVWLRLVRSIFAGWETGDFSNTDWAHPLAQMSDKGVGLFHVRDGPAIAAVLARLETLNPDDESEGELSKAMISIRATRQELQKSEHASPALLQRLEKADRALQREYLAKTSPAGLAAGDHARARGE